MPRSINISKKLNNSAPSTLSRNEIRPFPNLLLYLTIDLKMPFTAPSKTHSTGVY